MTHFPKKNSGPRCEERAATVPPVAVVGGVHGLVAALPRPNGHHLGLEVATASARIGDGLCGTILLLGTQIRRKQWLASSTLSLEIWGEPSRIA